MSSHMISRTYMYKDTMTLRLHELVWPKPEYCIQAWSPYLWRHWSFRKWL